MRQRVTDRIDRDRRGANGNCQGNLTTLTQPRTFAAWLRLLFRKDWVVYVKRPFGGPQYVLQYLGRYTHRVAISNQRLVSSPKGHHFRSTKELEEVITNCCQLWPQSGIIRVSGTSQRSYGTL